MRRWIFSEAETRRHKLIALACMALATIGYWFIVYYGNTEWSISNTTRGRVYLITAIVMLLNSKRWAIQNMGMVLIFLGIGLRNTHAFHDPIWASEKGIIDSLTTVGTIMLVVGIILWLLQATFGEDTKPASTKPIDVIG